MVDAISVPDRGYRHRIWQCAERDATVRALRGGRDRDDIEDKLAKNAARRQRARIEILSPRGNAAR